MASVSCRLSEEQFLCSICLEVFSAPVTTPCGHSFCSACINLHWDSSDSITCPLCKQDLSSTPHLKVSTVLAEMVSQLKVTPEDEDLVTEKEISELQSSAPVEVDCDLCSEPRLRALKSCLVCLFSYCQSHIQPHLTNPRLRRHQLIEARPNLEEHICPEHNWPLQLFCRDHSHFLCLECSYVEDKSHDTVPLKKECEAQQAEVKEQIKQRLLKIEEIRGSVEVSQKNADSEIQEGIRVFNTLMECVQQSLDSLKQSIEEKHRKSEEEAAQLIKKIQTEISALEQREAEMERLWSSGDHLQFVQTFTSTKPAPPLKDWTEETVRAPTYEGRVAKAVSELERNLYPQMEQIFEAELKKIKEFAVEVTLDPDTANPNLDLSEDLKQVNHRDHEKDLPDNPERFSSFFSVFAKQKFSSGKVYFEVQVKGKIAWKIGVAKESVNRKEENTQTPQNGHWLIYMSDDEYKTEEEPPVILPMRSSPEKVGVFVDYDEGLISYYDVGKTNLIYSFTDCCFTENILPLLNPYDNDDGANSAPLVLTPVAK
uniref:E3 ubiquitin-protein ligase TRIM21-like n=1 Tax=Neogobius melanostomus TaxID=47308 RepID=A0A8C6SB87_9GOBI